MKEKEGKMKQAKVKSLAIVLLGIATLSTTATAATLIATQVPGDRSSFTIEFDDVNSDRLFSLSELTSFSGVTVWTNFYNGISSVAAISGITSNCTSCGSSSWVFVTLPVDEFSANYFVAGSEGWTYTLTGLPPLTPPPPPATPTATANGPTNTPVPTATATNPPPNTATPTTAASPVLDHFTCYKANATKGSTKFAARTGDTVIDAFGSSEIAVARPRSLCAPTDKNGEDPTAPSHAEHLEAYQLKTAAPPNLPTAQVVIDQFNPAGLSLDPKRLSHLLVPTAKSHGATPPPPAALVIDHFTCYVVRIPHGAPRFEPVTATIVDQFAQPMLVAVKKPRFLCLPANKNGEDPLAPTHATGLMCYQLKQLSAPAFTRVSPLFVSNQFGPETLDAVKPTELCVPTTTPP